MNQFSYGSNIPIIAINTSITPATILTTLVNLLAAK